MAKYDYEFDGNRLLVATLKYGYISHTLIGEDTPLSYTDEDGKEKFDETGMSLKSFHIAMREDFKELDNLEHFVDLIGENPDTAFSVYNAEKGRVVTT